ncbi:MAG: hypothetical protein LAT51_13310 [Flavobacteriaceae bacterium]|nr:hypothetical protein [Flavobacteriaceae bacterium]
MKRPFNIFPSIGYRNSQFQIVTSVDNLKIDIYDQDKVIKSIETKSNYPVLMTSLNSTGKLLAKCKLNDEVFQQEIEIKEAFRLGSSEFKKAFVFDNTDYSFFLMKDRLLLYDEKKKILFTENHYSPTEIHKINQTNYLFVTEIGNSTNGIINLGIYNTETYSIVGELLNDYREIKILPDNNKAWLYNIQSKTIHCYELAQNTNRYFTELKSIDGISDFFLDDASQNIYINRNETLLFSSLNNLHKTLEVIKTAKNAIDKFGRVFTIEDNKLTCEKVFTNYSETVKIDFKVNLENENFLHIGSNFKLNLEFTDLNSKVEEIKNEIISSLPVSKTDHYLALPASKRITEVCTTHRIYLAIDGVYIVKKKLKRDFNGVKFKKHQANWTATPYTIENTQSDLSFLSSNKIEVLIDKASSLKISEHHNSMLLVNSNNTQYLFSGNNKLTLDKESSIEFYTVNEIEYFLIKSKNKYSLYRLASLKTAILDQIEILNPNLIEQHKIIWYRGKENYLKAFDLKSCSKILIDEQKVQHSLFKDALGFKFLDGYAFTSNQILFNPLNLEIRDAIIGNIISYSKELNKIVSHRTDIIYLSVFNSGRGKYELSDVSIEDKKYKESYLSPNGQFLVLQDESNQYSYYDIERNETVNFISGNFLAFQHEGSLIVEQDRTRAVKILDPKSFQDITPPNYHHYRFMSPNGKLYAKVLSKEKYINKLNDNEITKYDVAKYRKDLDEISSILPEKEKKKAQLKVDKNRLQIFTSHKEKFNSIGIKDYNKINSHQIIQIDKYVEVGITGTDIIKEIKIPTDTQYYNYAAFSFDNKYLGIVGKPTFGSVNRSLIIICSLSFDESNQKLDITNYSISRFPRYATWVCGFSKTGYFATYDSSPDTFLIRMDNSFFFNVTNDTELRNNIQKSRSNIYYSYKNWKVIKGKNFLGFSPSGNFLALSEEGYEPLTLGGYGHQESNVIHLAKTESGVIINSFTGHGDKIKEDIRKKLKFVAFSEDEKRIMTLSSDGVVIIRDININSENPNV